jgi:hypothetical protein
VCGWELFKTGAHVLKTVKACTFETKTKSSRQKSKISCTSINLATLHSSPDFIEGTPLSEINNPLVFINKQKTLEKQNG